MTNPNNSDTPQETPKRERRLEETATADPNTLPNALPNAQTLPDAQNAAEEQSGPSAQNAADHSAIRSRAFSTADEDQTFDSAELPPGELPPATITDNRDIFGSVSPTDATVLSDSPPFEYVAAPIADGADAQTLPKQFFATGTVPLGSELGHFKITKYIGGGGMGRVYEAIDKALDRKVAIKVLPRQRAQDAASVARFLNEARSAARLNHEHIAQVYFCGEENGIPFIAFEYVQGINLRAYVERGGVIPLPKAINFLLQIASALAHAALHGVTHRDVKPSNILITHQGKAKLIDMGLARLLRPSDPTEDLTVSGVTLGTFDYISPEQARDPRLADVRSDIYSLGCTFFFMLTGQPPFPEGTVLQKLLKHQGDEPPDVRTFVPGIPAEVVAVIQKMMAKDPANRFQTPDELITVLVGIAESIGLRATGPNKTDWVMPKVQKRVILLRHLPWISAIAALVVAVGIYRYVTRTEDDTFTLPSKNWPAAERSPDREPAGGESPGGPLTTEGSVPSAPPTVSPLPERSLAIRLLTADNAAPNTPSALDAASTGGNGKTTGSAFAPGLAGGWSVVPFALSSVINAPELRDLTTGQFADVRQLILPGSGELTGRWSSIRDSAAPTAPITGASETVSADENRTVLVVDRVGERSGYFATLEATLAEAAAMSDQKETGREIQIELAFNGPLEIPPLEISGRTLHIAAAEGFRPQLIFRPKEAARDALPNRLFLLNNAGLELENLSIDADLTQRGTAADGWSLFELAGAATLTLTDVTLTVCDPETPNTESTDPARAAFFRIPDPVSVVVSPTSSGNAVSDAALGEGNAAASFSRENAPAILLTRTFLRGEAVVWTVGASASGHLKMTTSGFCVEGPLAVRRAGTALSPTESLTVALDRVCGICRSPLFREQRLEPGREVFSIKTTISRSILKLSDTPVGELIAGEFYPENALPPDWTFSESLLYNASALWRFRSSVRPEESRDTVFNPPRFRRLENITSDADPLLSIPLHLTTRSDLKEHFLRPVETDLQTASERNTAEALRDGFFRQQPNAEEGK